MADALQRYNVLQLGLALGDALRRQSVGVREVAGSDSVDTDAAGRPLEGEAFGEAAEASLGGGVGDDASGGADGVEAGDVDDVRGLALGEQMGAEDVTAHVGLSQVDINHLVPVGLGEDGAAGPR